MSILEWTTGENILFGLMRQATNIAAVMPREAAIALSLLTEELSKENRRGFASPVFCVNEIVLLC